MHIPVLMHEALAPFLEKSSGVFVDLTLGGGGYSRYLLENVKDSRVIAFDCDAEAIARAQVAFKKHLANGRLQLVHANYSEITPELRKLNVTAVDGIVADLGFSSYQMDQPERGFSFLNDGPLDMRLDTNVVTTAYEIVNSWDESALAGIFRKYGEERLAGRIAKKIAEARIHQEISSTGALARIIKNAVPAKVQQKSSIHPATKCFQAIRIQVNNELGHLEALLPQVPALLKEGGVAAFVSFHSLEDRQIKNFIRRLTDQCICVDSAVACARCYNPPAEKVGKKFQTPSPTEIQINPRSRSAKLRMFRRLNVDLNTDAPR